MMPKNAPNRHRRIAARFTEIAQGVTDWDAPTPVPEWTAMDVIGHLVSWLPPFLAEGGVELPPGPSVDDDPMAAWHHQTRAVQDLLDGPGDTMAFHHPHTGHQPLTQVISNFYTADVFMHSWDLARSSGQDDHLDEDFAAQLLDGLREQEQMIRDSGQFGTAQPVSDDAGSVEQLMAFIGRDPSWAPPA